MEIWKTVVFKNSIDADVAAGWERADAEAFHVLQAVQPAMAAALREDDPRYAASTYALTDVFHRRVRMQEEASAAAPPPLYRNLRGEFGLVGSDPSWANLLTADANGVRGLTSSALVNGACDDRNFKPEGFAAFGSTADGTNSYTTIRSPVVCFESAPTDERGMHSALMGRTDGYFPPNTLFRLKKVDRTGFTAPNGVFVRQPLYTVVATYRPPRDAAAAGGAAGRYMAPPTTLQYGNREAYVRALRGVTDAPMLTMRAEFSRAVAWTDWLGVPYTLVAEWRYVTGPAARKDGCTPGVRDANNAGKTPAQFLREANAFIEGRRAAGRGLSLGRAHALLTLDEVLAIRLYTGPAYQPINGFLRQIANVSGEHRTRLARDVRLTYASTVRHICDGIRKLAAVATAEELAAPLYRGVRGELPNAFWFPDEQGMVIATDAAFMSTSVARETPLHYMGGEKNVLWELRPGPQTDEAFHRGADVAMLSQFAAEREVLFPPCTMLRVLRRDAGGEADGAAAGGVDRRHAGLRVNSGCFELQKRFIAIEVQPSFV